MTSQRLNPIGGRIMRATVLDQCARPAYGDRAKVISAGFATVAQTANYDDGTEINEKNANGDTYLYRPARAKLINLNVSVTFVAVDPELFTAFTGMPVIYSRTTGKAIGFKTSDRVVPLEVGVALEVWSNDQTTVPCDDDGEVPWVYFLWPWLSGGKIGDYSIEDGAVTFSVTDMFTRRGAGWDVGPYLIDLDSTESPAPLAEPVAEDQHSIVQEVLLAPPVVTVDGLTPLDDPDSPASTGATAGTPGAFTPDPSVRPYDLAELEANVDATPTTAWTTGQYVVLGDGSWVHWDGTEWVAGRA